MEDPKIQITEPKTIILSPQVEASRGYHLVYTSVPKSKGTSKNIYEYYKRDQDLSYVALVRGDSKARKISLGSLKNPNSTINQITRVIDQSFSSNETFDRKKLVSLLPKRLTQGQKLKSTLEILTVEGFLNRTEKEEKGRLHIEFMKTKKRGFLPVPKSFLNKFLKPNKIIPEKTKFYKKKYGQPIQEVVFKKLPRNAKKVETYPIQRPNSKVTIASLPELGGSKVYYIEEIKLSSEEQEILKKSFDIINSEIEPPKEDVDAKTHIAEEAKRLAEKYGYLKKLSPESWQKVLYYLERDLISFGPIHAIMKDPMIEDLSLNGLGIPVYVWHRKYESMPTNLTFIDENALDNLVVKLTHLAKKHISTAFPILDGMLPGKDRLSATFQREVSPKGGSFTIRRFREEPFSAVDLVDLGTLDESIAAYFWLLIENRMTIAVIGGTGAGKTSTLNALASLTKPSMKIVTVEEIPELNLPHENWVQLVSRESYGLGAMKSGEVSLFDLVKTSLRYRPDYIVVGEIRGEEAFVLFQALATGHGGLSTLHAENLDYAVKRLTSPPMNVAKVYVPLINVAAIVQRVQLPIAKSGVTFGRRLKTIAEIVDYEKYNTVSTWDPINDSFKVDLSHSVHLEKIALTFGITMKDVLDEVEKRAALLHALKLKGIKRNVEVAKFIANYYQESPFPPIRSKPEGEKEG
jgi:flagellar protein FlaI